MNKELQKFCITFGQKSPFRNSWVEIEAENQEKAMEIADYSIGKNCWSNIYPFGVFMSNHSRYFADGKIGLTII